MTRRPDVLIVGGGIVGLATAFELSERYPDLHLTILEKENDVACHQSGRNSGVLHSGIYYTPGSLKARLCRRGRRRMLQFCAAHEVAYEICGKVIVATSPEQESRLLAIERSGLENGVGCTLIGRQQLQDLEPAARGVRALHVPDAGIVDYKRVCQVLAGLLRNRGHDIRLGSKVTRLRSGVREAWAEGPNLNMSAGAVVNCAGLHADRLARASGAQPDMQIVPFRGLYYELGESARHLCRNLIYPVPDPAYPFLGVHVTRMTDGRVECGPNAVLATGREAYNLQTWNMKDLRETLTYRGFLRLAAAHWPTGAAELVRTLFKGAYVREMRKLIPGVMRAEVRYSRSGIRAQAVKPDGTLVDDFVVLRQDRVVHVCNAPSPGATSSFALATYIADQIKHPHGLD